MAKRRVATGGPDALLKFDLSLIITQQAKKALSENMKRRISGMLSEWLRAFKRKAVEYAPRETGALESGHFAHKVKRFVGEAGFEFNDRQRANNKAHGNPPDEFYGYMLHEGLFAWEPKGKGTGPGWLHKALRDTASIRRQIYKTAITAERSTIYPEDVKEGEREVGFKRGASLVRRAGRS